MLTKQQSNNSVEEKSNYGSGEEKSNNDSDGENQIMVQLKKNQIPVSPAADANKAAASFLLSCSLSSALRASSYFFVW